MSSQPQRELLDVTSFLTRADHSVRNWNQRFNVALVFDEHRVRRAHKSSKDELEILLNSTNTDELVEAFDTFVDLLVDSLIREKAFSHVLASGSVDPQTVRGLLQTFAEILGPIVVMEDWLRSIIFAATNLTIPSFFCDANVPRIGQLSNGIQANPEDARNWRRLIGYANSDEVRHDSNMNPNMQR